MATAEILSCFRMELSFNSLDAYGGSGYIHWSFFWKALVWHTSASLCKNENGICTPAELQAVAKNFFIQLLQKTRLGKDVVQEDLDYSAIVMMSTKLWSFRNLRWLHYNEAGSHFDLIASQNVLSLRSCQEAGVHTTFSTHHFLHWVILGGKPVNLFQSSKFTNFYKFLQYVRR